MDFVDSNLNALIPCRTINNLTDRSKRMHRKSVNVIMFSSTYTHVGICICVSSCSDALLWNKVECIVSLIIMFHRPHACRTGK